MSDNFITASACPILRSAANKTAWRYTKDESNRQLYKQLHLVSRVNNREANSLQKGWYSMFVCLFVFLTTLVPLPVALCLTAKMVLYSTSSQAKFPAWNRSESWCMQSFFLNTLPLFCEKAFIAVLTPTLCLNNYSQGYGLMELKWVIQVV